MKKISEYRNIVVLTGAGISVESGLGTYRDKDGQWLDQETEKVMSIDTLRTSPENCLAFYRKTLENVLNHNPNEAHRLLVELEANCDSFTLATLNIDGYHQTAGSKNVLEIHGSIRRCRCMNNSCDFRGDYSTSLSTCPLCSNLLRPDIVLYGEPLDGLSVLKIRKHLRECDLFIAIGASGYVYPASAFVDEAQEYGADTLNINLSPSENFCFSDQIIKSATEGLREILRI